MALAILFEDNFLVAADKPAGVAVIPARDEPPASSLRARLEAQLGTALWVVHRIDRDTSGVVLFAKDAETHRRLNAAFEARSVRKSYRAFTRGAPPSREGTIDVALHAARKGKMRPALAGESDALPSATDYAVLHVRDTRVGPVAIVQAEPKTGRQHQIRVHLRACGAPLLVDRLYGRCERLAPGELGDGSPALPRLTLHATRLALAHPHTGAALTIEAPLADDLAALDRWLRRQS